MSKVLEVNNINKSFVEYASEWQRIFTWFGFKSKSKVEHKILNHVNFSIAPGEAIGIVGQNGAGKSTLLKIITGTLKPSSGEVQVNGRISAILELGMGFSPDLTGRENTYHAAGIMGFTREQIDTVIKDVEDFVEIGDYFDEPVRTYSSGMQMRVAFGVATMYRPEILIVDEALSVGDAYFQHKSFEKIREFQKQGTTLLLVSHDKGAIQAICDRAILLEKGTVIKDGEPEAVMDFYNALIAEKENSTIKQTMDTEGKIATVSGTGETTIEDIAIFNQKGERVKYISVGEQVLLKIRIKANEKIPKLVAGYLIKDRLGQEVFGTNTYHHNRVIHDAKEDDFFEIEFLFSANLGVGSYSITVALHAEDTHISSNYIWKDHALLFNIVNTDKREFVGIAWLAQEIRVTHVK